VTVRGLPAGFENVRIAFLTDFHRGVFISQEFVLKGVEMAQALRPDLILLGGDYVDYDPALIVPVMEALGGFNAPLGVFAVQGNRDIRANRILTSRELARQGILEITNRGIWVERNGSKIYLAGFDDATIGSPDIPAGLSDATSGAIILALTHSPALVDRLKDPRIRLVCCGHTHGGQINLPLIGPPIIPKGCGNYAVGLIQSPNAKVFVSAGIGVAYAPLRFRCPPEISMLTLTAG
jgi:predicted MPP superfamily phosphohydrolase